MPLFKLTINVLADLVSLPFKSDMELLMLLSNPKEIVEEQKNIAQLLITMSPYKTKNALTVPYIMFWYLLLSAELEWIQGGSRPEPHQDDSHSSEEHPF